MTVQAIISYFVGIRVDHSLSLWGGVSLLGVSAWALTSAWPYIWPQALVRPIAALGRHGDPVAGTLAWLNTVETLTSWAWGDAPARVALSVGCFFAAVVLLWTAHRAPARRVQT